jgi:hypothetical protein
MITELVQRFAKAYQSNDIFYIAEKNGLTKKTPGGTKELYDYTRLFQKLNDQDYEKHIRGEKYLTLVPLRPDGTCNWGAIDVDTYDKSFIDQIIIKSEKTPLIPVISASGGLHLYIHSKQFIPADLMRLTLRKLAASVGLNKVEIFPKQSDLKSGKNVGNGIKLTCYKTDQEKLSKHLSLIESKAQDEDYFISFKNLNKPEEQLKEESKETKVDTNDLNEIIKNLKNKKDHSRGGDVDNHIVDFISVAVGLNFTDKEIRKRLSVVKSEIMQGSNATKFGNFEKYINIRINNFRKNYSIQDPDTARKDFLNNVVYLKDTTNYFDKKNNKIYKPDAIKVGFSKELAVADAIKFFKDSRDRVLCENFKYRPQQYDPNEQIIIVDKLKYINKYRPYDLEPEYDQDVSLFLKLVEHVIPEEIVREFFLDFICYHYQYPGEKIRFAFILQTSEFQIGKGSIWYGIKNTLGDNVKKVDIEESLDKAKQFLTDRQLVLIDEMKSKGDWDEREEILNKFKLFITEEEHSSRKLYVDYDTIKDSCTNFMFFTNYKDAIVLPENETRYAVYHSRAKRTDDDFYSNYHEWIASSKGKRALLGFFKSRKISETFNPKGVAPRWDSLREMSLAGEKTLDQVLRSLYDQMLPPFEDDRRIISSTWLDMWCKKNHIKVPRLNNIAYFLEKIGGINKGQITIEYNNNYFRPTLWIIRHNDLIKDYSNEQIGKEFLDRYITDKLTYKIQMFGEAEVKDGWQR